jgi:hypothetical protein
LEVQGEKKYLIDVIKITASNLFYAVMKPFKKAYNNDRDDYVWFRHLTQSGGTIEATGEGEFPALTIKWARWGSNPRPRDYESLLYGIPS